MKRKRRSYGEGRVFRRGAIWWIAWCQGGVEVRESARSPVKAEAEYRRLGRKSLKALRCHASTLIEGHQDRAVFCRYNVSSDDDKAAALTRVGAYLEKADTTPNVQAHPVMKTAGRSMSRTEIVRMSGAESSAPVTQPFNPPMIPSSPAAEMGLSQ